MQDLKVIGVEDGALVAATEHGERFRIVINDVLLSHLRPPRESKAEEKRLSPREIQAHIRSGMSAEEVAQVTGASIEYVERFEGPVLAEREHIVGSALSVPVLATIDLPEGEEPTFGAAITARLEGLGARGERWTSWKEPGGSWVVKLSFTADTIEHDARWSYEPKKHTLAPLNREAITLSKQGDLPHGLIPRLRAVESEAAGGSEEPPSPDESRFDSGAFRFRDPEEEDPKTIALLEPAVLAPRHPSAASNAAIRAEKTDSSGVSNQTADLLEALRKRRGQREAAPEPAVNDTGAPEGDGAEDTPLDFASLSEEPAEKPAGSRRGSGRSKRGRASMPSWDEIVFGARSDNDD